MIERRRYRERPPRGEYFLTDAGLAVSPVWRELHNWGERFVQNR